MIDAIASFPKAIQILHFTGCQELTEIAKNSYQQRKIPYCVKDFEKRMDLAWAIADFAVTRSGAGTIAELIASHTPALLIPFPYATDQHQVYNAKYFTEVVGGGVLCLEQEISISMVHQVLHSFMDEQSLVYKKNIHHYKSQRTSKKLADLVLETLK